MSEVRRERRERIGLRRQVRALLAAWIAWRSRHGRGGHRRQRAVIRRARGRAAAVGRDAVAVIPDADHGFDQCEKSPLSTLPFDAGQREAAREFVERFLDTYAP